MSRRPFRRTPLAAALLGLAAACGLSGCASPPELVVRLDKTRMEQTLRRRYGGRLPVNEVPERVQTAQASADADLLAAVRARLSRLGATNDVSVSQEPDGAVRVRLPDESTCDDAARLAPVLALRGEISLEAAFPEDDPYAARVLEVFAVTESDRPDAPSGFLFRGAPDASPGFVHDPSGAPPPPNAGDAVPTISELGTGSWNWRFVPRRASDGRIAFAPLRTFPAGREDLLVEEARCEPSEDRNGGWRVLARLAPASARETDRALRHLPPVSRAKTGEEPDPPRLAAVFAPYALPDAAVLTNGAARTLVLAGFANRRDAEFVAGLLSDAPLPAPVLVERVGAWVAPRANPPQAP